MTVRILLIDSCRDCPFYEWEGSLCSLFRVPPSSSPAEEKTGETEGGEDAARLPAVQAGRTISYRGCRIPPWCPLPAAPEGSESDRSARSPEVWQ